MAIFTVRIVLHDAEWEDYEKLYEEMGEEGFTDEISSKDVRTYKMPDGEYSITGTYTESDVLAKARSAASTTKKQYAVFVTKSGGRTWYGLEEIRK